MHPGGSPVGLMAELLCLLGTYLLSLCSGVSGLREGRTQDRSPVAMLCYDSVAVTTDLAKFLSEMGCPHQK